MAPPKPDANENIQDIISAQEHQLRAVLKVVCTSDADTVNRAWSALTRIKVFEVQKRKVDDGAASIGSEVKRAKLIEDVHHCIRCSKVFLQVDNHKKACWHYPSGFKLSPLIPYDTLTLHRVDPELGI